MNYTLIVNLQPLTKLQGRSWVKGKIRKIFTRRCDAYAVYFLGTSISTQDREDIEHSTVLADLRRLHEYFGAPVFSNEKYDPSNPCLFFKEDL